MPEKPSEGSDSTRAELLELLALDNAAMKILMYAMIHTHPDPLALLKAFDLYARFDEAQSLASDVSDASIARTQITLAAWRDMIERVGR